MDKNPSIQVEFVGLVDADLLDNGTRHPNLTLMKIAGFLHDNNIDFELIIDENADISKYTRIYMSRVFSFTKEPNFYINASEEDRVKFLIGGTGYYANESKVSAYRVKREEDLSLLDNDKFLRTLQNCQGEHKVFGIDMARQKPYYHLYDAYVENQVKRGLKSDKYKDYQMYSIGFLTRGCVRHCPFCVNKLENRVYRYSKL